MNQDLTVQKIFVWKKKFVQRGSPEKQIPAQAVSEKKIRASWKFPPPHHFSNGPSLSVRLIEGVRLIGGPLNGGFTVITSSDNNYSTLNSHHPLHYNSSMLSASHVQCIWINSSLT